MALGWELLMALAMLWTLVGPSLGAFHDPCYSLELEWPFVGSFSWTLLCLGTWMALRWKLLMALATLGCLDGSLLEASHGHCYAWELRWPFVGSFS